MENVNGKAQIYMDYKVMWENLKAQIEEMHHLEDSDQLENMGCISGEVLWRMEQLEKENDFSGKALYCCPCCQKITGVETSTLFIEAGKYDEERDCYTEEGFVTQYKCKNEECRGVFYIHEMEE